MSVNCIFIREYLWHVSRQQCRNHNESFSFDLYGDQYGMIDLFFLGDLLCATDGYNQILYKFSGVLLCISIGLSIMLLSILYLRSRPNKQTKLFDWTFIGPVPKTPVLGTLKFRTLLSHINIDSAHIEVIL